MHEILGLVPKNNSVTLLLVGGGNLLFSQSGLNSKFNKLFMCLLNPVRQL